MKYTQSHQYIGQKYSGTVGGSNDDNFFFAIFVSRQEGYEKYNDGEMSDYIPTDDDLAKGFATIPNVNL